MSLINQMLKDLEQRRASGYAHAASPLHGVGTVPPVAESSRNTLLIPLVALSVLLLIATAWLVMERNAPGSSGALTTPASTMATTTATAQPGPAIVEEARAVASTIPEEARTNVPPEAATSPTPVAVAQPADSRPNGKGVPQDTATAEPIAKADTASVTQAALPPRRARTVRAVTPAQQSEYAFRQGLALLDNSDSRRALAELQRAISLHPGHHQARATLVALLIRQGRVAEASGLLQRGLQLAPAHAGFAKMQARLLAERGEWQPALQLLERARDNSRQAPDYLALMAALYQKTGAHDRAIDQYRQLLQRHPEQGTWWMGLAISLEAGQQPAPALDAFQRALDRVHNQPQVARYIESRIDALQAGRSHSNHSGME